VDCLPEENTVNALVTGATGFPGSHLVRKLVDRGGDVRCFVRKTKLVHYPLALSAAAMGSLYEMAVKKSAPLNLHKLRLLSTDFHLSIEKAKRKLGFQPTTSLEAGLRTFVEDCVAGKKAVGVS